MSWFVYVAVTLLSLVQGNPTVRSSQQQAPPAAGQSIGYVQQQQSTLQYNKMESKPALTPAETMPVEELDPSHYPARRAAHVAQHYLNTQHGSPFKLLGVDRVVSATLEKIAGVGMKYFVVFALKEMITNEPMGQCSTEVLYPIGEEQAPPQVQCSCDGLLQIDTKAHEEALYQQLKASDSLVSGHNIPDSYGFIAPEMKPFWHLGGVASSFVMLKESNESTLYNMAQVVNVTQQESQDKELTFQYHVLLHEMVSQEIIHWKLLVSWCPAEGVRVLQTEWQPKCHHCVAPPSNTTLTLYSPS
ncbi:hypothetical protein MATL_G00120680 [Megalops atlanticus]|uniref:Cystatin LXN-type domain-containing protein n=1 Tax=Megalops atlanticus TaxID=7932 RepID=A0A9D3T8C3_MEGAT|nr:hypothetical protein MATL_G00120680 [Megalops atlanticus]